MTAIVVAFQLALALGAPWGGVAMGGAFPGAYPPALRFAALLQGGALAGLGAVVLSRAGVVLPQWRGASRRLIWLVVALLVPALIANLVTPSAMERLIWAPVVFALLITSLRVALAALP